MKKNTYLRNSLKNKEDNEEKKQIMETVSNVQNVVMTAIINEDYDNSKKIFQDLSYYIYLVENAPEELENFGIEPKSKVSSDVIYYAIVLARQLGYDDFVIENCNKIITRKNENPKETQIKAVRKFLNETIKKREQENETEEAREKLTKLNYRVEITFPHRNKGFDTINTEILESKNNFDLNKKLIVKI